MNCNQEPQSIKIVVVGDSSVGKTSILLTYTQDKFPIDYVPTVFENYSNVISVDNTQVQLTLWDTAGQESYERLRLLSYQSANAFLIVFSVDNMDSFNNVWSKWKPELEMAGKKDLPKLIVGNKSDKLKDPDKFQMFWERCEQEGLKYRQCSAFLNNNIKNIFEELVSMTISERQPSTILRSTMRKESIKQLKSGCQLL
ncbi:unnamed protein product (macronuclear) [Paramecium tetraurelia]|uniref:Chromosome undetermined scaffold_132, whole genome shotgun sequence n=1 Tax=Paramecium tetraurelia TaxID=5888 RepID=Q3SDU0_PARTE|nr:uncharacterized protein GSPATT00032749001 [Paramecium tetraurelia]CAI39268.1 rab_C90 [Paramecium tetraurelia]CAK62897.1 unnamed protein product [Paramecium tetraurelia]|eukprot:XP_001430295.1 hypothetical protein (macronuclear) [Paramecium tetraurelia strain d4-2]